MEWHSPLSPAEVSKALCQTIDAVDIPAPFAIGYPSLMFRDVRPGTKPYLGRVDSSSLIIQARTSGADPFALLCIGEITPAHDGSLVRLRFRFHRVVTWFFRIAALWALVVCAAFLFQERSTSSLLAPAVVLAVAGGVLGYARLRHRAQRAEVIATLEHALMPEFKQVA